VRVKVLVAAVNAVEHKIMSGDYLGKAVHSGSSPLILGYDFSGTVDKVGKQAADFKEGDAVWGFLAYSPTQKQGTYAEYVTVKPETIALKPETVAYDVAAAAATSCSTALQGLRDYGQLEVGGRLLIIGAAGNVGSAALGIAKLFMKAKKVTAVCSHKDMDRVKSLGADDVVDRTALKTVLVEEAIYDVVFDACGGSSFSDCAKSLTAKGAYVTTVPNVNFLLGVLKACCSSKTDSLVRCASKKDDLDLIGQYLTDGLQIAIDSHFNITDLDAAFKRSLDKDRQGKIVIDVADKWDN